MPAKTRSRRGATHDAPVAPARSVLAADTLPQPYVRVVIAVLLLFGVGLRWANLDNVASRTPDEAVYTGQANVVRSEGTAGVRKMTAQYRREPDARLYPPPTRAGYIWLLAGVMSLSDRADEGAGADLSAACSVGSLLLLAWVGLRFFPAWATVFAVLFYAVSPPELVMARRAWQDCLIEFLGLALVAVAAEIMRDSRRRIWYLVFVLIGSFGVVVKESWALIYALWALGVLGVVLVARRDWKNGLLLAAAGLAGLAASVAWLASQVGGFSDLYQIVSQIPNANAANPYAKEFQTGPGYLLLRAFRILAPIPALLCLPGLVVGLFPRTVPERLRTSPNGARGGIVRWMALFVPVFLAFPFVLPHWLNLRYVSVLFPAVYLLAGLGFWFCASACWGWLRGSTRGLLAVLVLALLVLGAFADYERFQRIFVRNNIPDLSVKLVVDYGLR